MTSNTRVVVIGAGRAGGRPVRRPGEHVDAPVTGATPETPEARVGDEEHRPYGRVPLGEVPTGRRHTAEVTARPMPAELGSPRLRPMLPLLPHDGGS